MVEIELKSKELKEYVYLKLNKDRNMPIYDEDVEKFEAITLNGLDFLGEPTDVTLFDLVFFTNLESCVFININISAREIDILNSMKNIKFVQFTNCFFPKSKKVQLNAETLIFDKCPVVEMSNFEEITNLTKLRIINCGIVNQKGMENFQKLTHVYIQNMDLDNIREVEKLTNLKYLNLNGTTVVDMGNIEKNKNVRIVHEEENYIYDVEDEGV